MTTSEIGPAAPAPERPRHDVADVVRLYGDAYRQTHRLPTSALHVMHAIDACRTASLGGHLERCTDCRFERPAYNSCRNRHCPTCQSLTKARWLEARQADLLPVEYVHTVFTVPHDLNGLMRANTACLYRILFDAVADTLLTVGADPRHGLGGQLGFLAILHTWDQQLRYHVHLHGVVAGGALDVDGDRWVSARPTFLFPVRAPTAFRAWLEALRRKAWVVYAKPPFGGPAQVLDYLGRYTHRVARSNHRLTRVADGQVSFTYRDRQHGGVLRELTLPAESVIDRFLLHVLPPHFVRIRHVGFLANRAKKTRLGQCRRLLHAAPPPPVSTRTTAEHIHALTGVDRSTCPTVTRARWSSSNTGPARRGPPATARRLPSKTPRDPPRHPRPPSAQCGSPHRPLGTRLPRRRRSPLLPLPVARSHHAVRPLDTHAATPRARHVAPSLIQSP